MKEDKTYDVSPWHPQGHSAKYAAQVAPESNCTHIDFVLLMADEEVVHHACFVEIPEADHVFYPLGRGGMHQAHHVHVPSCDPVFLKQARQQF